MIAISATSNSRSRTTRLKYCAALPFTSRKFSLSLRVLNCRVTSWSPMSVLSMVLLRNFKRACSSARAGDAARSEERFQRLAAECGDHLRVRDAFGARELLQAEEARAVVLHRLPVEAPHHVALGFAQVLHRRLRVAPQELAHVLAREAVQETVQAQPARATLEIEDVLTQRARLPLRWSSAGSSCRAAGEHCRSRRRA